MLLIILIRLNTHWNIKPKLKVDDYFRNADKRNIFSKGYTSQPPTYKMEDINGEIIEGKYYEQELLKSEFDFESDNSFRIIKYRLTVSYEVDQGTCFADRPRVLSRQAGFIS